MDLDDGLDELLDEVETKLGGNESVDVNSRSEENHHRLREDVQDLLLELQVDELAPTQKEVPGAEKTRRNSAGRKCCPVFIGGTALRCGLATLTSHRSCDQLRCTSCDFRVLMFDDCVWDSCDYLFLRNNVPDLEKLRSRLKRRGGVRAYACQCSWMSSEHRTDLRDLRHLQALTWVCGGH